MNSSPLRVFVAMPGTEMGSGAKWSNPEDIKKHFYQGICDTLQKRLGRSVELVIEKDKLVAGSIHASMFQEATIAEVYIADLTGNNPNVYLELGVRWALMDRVTVLVSQDVGSIRFNAASSRAIPYGPMPAEIATAVERVAKTIENGLAASASYRDSPVREGQSLVAISRAELDRLQAELKRLEQQQGEESFHAAEAARDDVERLRLFRAAVAASPARADFQLALAVQLRAMNELVEARQAIERALALNKSSAPSWRELGVTLGLLARTTQQPGLIGEAVEALRKAVQLAPNDPEAYSNLGGALRRLAFSKGETVDWSSLSGAYDSYRRASEIDTHDTYARTNLAKVALLLSARDPNMVEKAAEHYRKVRPLVEFSLEDLPESDPNRVWKRFDLAEALLGIGKRDLGLQKYEEAIAATPPAQRKTVLLSVLSPIVELLSLGAGDAALKSALAEVRSKLDSAMKSEA